MPFYAFGRSYLTLRGRLATVLRILPLVHPWYASFESLITWSSFPLLRELRGDEDCNCCRDVCVFDCDAVRVDYDCHCISPVRVHQGVRLIPEPFNIQLSNSRWSPSSRNHLAGIMCLGTGNIAIFIRMFLYKFTIAVISVQPAGVPILCNMKRPVLVVCRCNEARTV